MDMLIILFFFASFFLTASAINDWNTPCFDGKCEYNMLSSSGSVSSSLKIWGSSSSISDITPSAGYEILDCSPDQLTQDIRLVCADNASGCDHLYQNAGAEGKIVRLPESCGTSAFARVAKAWIPEDQSLPPSISARLVNRAIQPQVKALTLDVNFDAIDTSQSGPVHFFVQGSNIPVVEAIAADSSRRSLDERELSNQINITNTTTLQPISVDKAFSLVNQSIPCTSTTASAQINVDAKTQAQVSFGVVVNGTLAPPQLNQFNIDVGLTADLTGNVDLVANASGSLDSGKIPIFTLGIPGLSFDGILEIGPSLEIDVEATATLDLDVDLSVGLNYHIDNAQLSFPPSNDTSQTQDNKFQIIDTPLNISASPAAASTGSVEAHIIPTLKFGISLLNVDTDVFLALDTSATLTLTLEEQTASSQSVRRANHAKLLNARSNKGSPPVAPAPTPASIVRKDYMPTASGSAATTSIAINPTCTCVLSPQSSIVTAVQGTETGTPSGTTTSSATQTTSTSSSSNDDSNSNFNGCFEVKAGLDVTAGADGDFFGLFDSNTQTTLFSKSFELFKKCFGSQATRRSRISGLERRKSLDRRDGLLCPAANISAPISVISQLLSTADIHSIPV